MSKFPYYERTPVVTPQLLYTYRTNISRCQSFNRYLSGSISICKADSYQIYFNIVAALVLTDALGPSPLPLEE